MVIKRGWFREKFILWKEEIYEHRKLILLSLIFLLVAVGINILCGRYTDKVGSAAVSDLILDHLPPMDFISPIFTYGYVVFIFVLFLYPLFFKVKELHMVISQFSLLFLIRSLFIILTHLKAPAGMVITGWNLSSNPLVFTNDLFFSGHAAMPFLGYLIFRKEKIGIFFLIATIILSFTALAMHMHYSIDVFAAFFIAYGSYKFGEWFFKKFNNY